MEVFEKYNILEPSLVDTFRDLLKDPEFKQELFKIITLQSNDSIKNLFSFVDDRENLNL